MARVLYGVHGTGHGHAMRGLTLARALPQHEFIFVCDDDAPKVLEREFHVERLPNLGTVFHDYRADIRATIARAVPVLWQRKRHIRKALGLIDKLKPDVCMTDLEYFVPRAASIAGLPCLTLDHQHVLTCCEHKLPPDMLWDALLQGLTPRYLFRPTEANIIISFYAPAVRKGYNAAIFPPILRKKTLDHTPSDQGHILVYQSNSTDRRLLDFLKISTNRTAHVFGYGREDGREGNIVFHRRSEDEFLRLLASCSFVIQGGSHTLMGEALYFGKPILSIPLMALVEQRLNAYYLERLGYGLAAQMAELEPGLMEEFERTLGRFQRNIRQKSFVGNREVFALVDTYLKTGKAPTFSRAS